MKHFKKILMIFIMSVIICNASYAQAVAPTNLSLKGIVDWTRNFDFIMTGETLPEVVPAKGIWFIQWTGSVPKLYVSDGAVWTNFQSASIVDGSVTTPKLADLAVTTPKIAQNAITSEKLDNLAVETSKIADNAITNDKLAVLSVDTVNVKDGAITSDKLAVDSVTSNKIVDGAITSNKVDSILNEKTISLNNGTLDSPSLKFTSSINTGFSYNATDSVLILGWLGDEKVSVSQDKLKLTDIEELNLDSENDIELSFTNEDTKIFGFKKWSLNNSLDLRLYNNLGGYLMSPIAIGATGSVIINNGQGADFPVDDGIHNLQVNGSMIANDIDSANINVASLTVTDILDTNLLSQNIIASNTTVDTLIVNNDIASLSVTDLEAENIVSASSTIDELTVVDSNITNATVASSTVNNLHTNLVNADVCPYFTCGEPSTLIGGDWYSDGYFGEVSGANLIYGWELLRDLWGMNKTTIDTKAKFIASFTTVFGSSISYKFNGTGYTTDEDNLEVEWLKFISDGKIIFIAKRPLLNNITWNEILERIPDYENGVDIKIPASRINANYTNGFVTLKCRLLTGGNHNPMFGDITDRGKEGVKLGQGSEWNRLMYRVCNQIPTDTNAGVSDGYSGGAQIGNNWANFTGSQLGFGGNDTLGRATWCQELSSYNGSAYQYRVYRGGEVGVGSVGSSTPSSRYTSLGFRPALVLESK